MTEIRFHQLVRTPLERALPPLLEKMLAAGVRAVVMAGSEERVEALNSLLWTHGERSFLPHASKRDGHPEQQPIWLTTEEEAPNGATCLVLTDGVVPQRVDRFERCFDLFDGRDEAAVAAARERWQRWKSEGHQVSYWTQGEQGGWEQKN
jgi:DNA polymerase-3 subunit chi